MIREKEKEERRKEEKIKKGKNNGCKESGRRVKDLGWKERNSKIRKGKKEVSTGTIPQVDQGF